MSVSPDVHKGMKMKLNKSFIQQTDSTATPIFTTQTLRFVFRAYAFKSHIPHVTIYGENIHTPAFRRKH